VTDVARLVRYPEYELLEARYLRHRFSMHSHDSFVLAVVTGGAERLRVEGRLHLARPGDVVLLSPGEAHDGAGHDQAGFAYRAVYPTRSLVARSLGLSPVALGPGSLTPNVVTDADAAAALGAACQRLTAGDDPLAGESALACALRLLWIRYGTPRPAGVPGVPAGAAATARDLIEARLAERVSLLELARACEATPLGLLRAFQASFGMPPHRYQLQRRIQLARRGLQGGTEPARLAAELGFADQSHFSRVFKSVVGVPPGAYQRAAAG
jgi:AraC-like DNA-binding protein